MKKSLIIKTNEDIKSLQSHCDGKCLQKRFCAYRDDIDAIVRQYDSTLLPCENLVNPRDDASVVCQFLEFGCKFIPSILILTCYVSLRCSRSFNWFLLCWGKWSWTDKATGCPTATLSQGFNVCSRASQLSFEPVLDNICMYCMQIVIDYFMATLHVIIL